MNFIRDLHEECMVCTNHGKSKLLKLILTVIIGIPTSLSVYLFIHRVSQVLHDGLVIHNIPWALSY